jgi:hypothetical protein
MRNFALIMKRLLNGRQNTVTFVNSALASIHPVFITLTVHINTFTLTLNLGRNIFSHNENFFYERWKYSLYSYV